MSAVSKKKCFYKEARGVFVPLNNAEIIRRCSSILGNYDPHKQRDVICALLQERGIEPKDFQREDGSFLLHAMRNRNVTLVVLPA